MNVMTMMMFWRKESRTGLTRLGLGRRRQRWRHWLGLGAYTLGHETAHGVEVLREMKACPRS